MHPSAPPRRRLVPVIGALAICVSAASAPAYAGTVDIVGGFYTYFGPLETPSAVGYQSKFDVPALGTVIGTPTEAIPGFDFAWSIGIGQGGVALYSTNNSGGNPTPASSVEFYRDRAFDPPLRNRIDFTPATGLDLQVGQTFKLGTFSFSNGGWLGDFPDGQFGFGLRTVSATPELNGHIFNAAIEFHVTTGCTPDYATCSSDPVANADYFHIVDQPEDLRPPVELGYVGVYEAEFLPSGGSTSGSIDIYARIGSLIPTSLANAQGVTLQAAIPTVGAIPEPQTWALLLVGLGVVLRRAQRRSVGAGKPPVHR